MLLRIFAKVGTDEKIAVMCYHNQAVSVMALLNKKYGCDWLPVDNVMSCIEGIKFSDGEVYKGFEADKDRYSPAIIQLVK